MCSQVYHGETAAPLELFEQIALRIAKSNLGETTRRFSTLHRASGTPDAEEAADYLLQKLEEYGIPHRRLRFTGYMSRAVDASLEMLSPQKTEFDVVPCGFTKNVTNLEGEVFYDALCEKERLTYQEQAERFRGAAGKFVLTKIYCSDVVLEAAAAGAIGVIGMYNGPGESPHYFGASNHNGAPTPENRHLLPQLPCVDCTRAAGKTILKAMEQGPVRVRMSARAETGPTEASIPVAFIQGTEENFVLMDGHYDCHCTGMTDNGGGDAILLELTRVFHEMRHLLRRSILVCWWAGHEFGQYAGSTWYSDTYFEQLRDHCVAHINIDIAGCSNAKQIRARTTRMEGQAFTEGLIRKYTGQEPKPYIQLPHLGEQSFLGREVPITIMLKYEALQSDTGGNVGGGNWWHSREDTLDKVDLDIAMRDAAINAEMICRIVNGRHLPVQMSEYLQESGRLLREIDGELTPEEFDLAPAFEKLAAVQAKVRELEEEIPKHDDTDAILQKVAGGLIQVEYTYTPPYDYDRLGIPANFQKFRAAMGATRENTDAETFLFLKTDFLRQRNRLCGELDRIIEQIDYQLLKWNCNSIQK